LDVLENPARNVPERHRSIRAVFEHSWNLLTEVEQEVFKKLSVFRGGYRREAAEVIAGATLGILSSLVDKSLLYVNTDGRYNLHELVLQYAEEKSGAEAEANRLAHEDHAVYYMNFLVERQIGMMVHMSPGVVAEITTDLKNIRSALDWVLEHDDIEQYGVALNCLMMFYQFRCLYEEGETVSGRIVAKLRRNPPTIVLCRMLIAHGWFAELHSQVMKQMRWKKAYCKVFTIRITPESLAVSHIAVQMGDCWAGS
jgi:predicted ATPase